jgi:hypothetical protein
VPPRIDDLLTLDAARYFRDLLRQARAAALRDAEDFRDILYAVERLGSMLPHERDNLGGYEESICALAARSPLAESLPRAWPAFHSPFPLLYTLVRRARNSAMHQGVYARHLTSHAMELCLVLENALEQRLEPIAADFMVRDPVAAALWQPVSFVRHTMLLNSFSFLPVEVQRSDVPPGWYLLSDLEVARYLRGGEVGDLSKRRLGESVEAAVQNGLVLYPAKTVPASTPIAALVKEVEPRPLLVVSNLEEARLVGILTPFDLL